MESYMTGHGLVLMIVKYLCYWFAVWLLEYAWVLAAHLCRSDVFAGLVGFAVGSAETA